MQREDLFAALDCAPTLDRDAVKRAYFRALALHPPHVDAEAFRRVRAAYEQLMVSGALEAAYLTSPLHLSGELARYQERFDSALAEACEGWRRQAAPRASLDALVDRLSRCKDPVDALAQFARRPESRAELARHDSASAEPARGPAARAETDSAQAPSVGGAAGSVTTPARRLPETTP